MAYRCRTIDWDDLALPFGDPPSTLVPTVEMLRADIADGMLWHWRYRGLLGILSLPVMQNALAAYDAYKRHRHQREPVPKAVGVFNWSDTISSQEWNELVNHGSKAEPATGSGTND